MDSWNTRKKQRVDYMLSQCLTYMSSEESGDEDDTNLHRRKLPWLKSKYQRALRCLDNAHYNSLPATSKLKLRKRKDGDEPSDRSPPENAPAYLLVDTSTPSLDDSTLSLESLTEDWTLDITIMCCFLCKLIVFCVNKFVSCFSDSNKNLLLITIIN